MRATERPAASAESPARSAPASGTAISSKLKGAQGADPRHAQMGAWAYFEGQLVPFEKATISIATHAFNYGTAVFEGIRAYQQESGGLAILFAAEHYQRMLRNGRLLRARVPESVTDLVAITREMLRRNEHDTDVYIRPLLYKGAATIKLGLADLDDRIAIFSFPMGNYVATEGLRVGLSAWQRVNDNAVPARGKVTGSYVNASLAVDDAHAAGYDEAILLTSDGHVAEASSANLFLLSEGEIATPPLSDDVLGGITRKAVIQLARDNGYTMVERKIDRTELYTADEVFFTGTGVQIAAVASIDGRPVGDGSTFPVTSDLQERYFDAVRGRNPRYRSWLTSV
jgi:branched-chain amino acid aminotransferase